MAKRIVALLLAATVISAGLLYLGIETMTNYGPALAGSLDALVASGRTPDGSDDAATGPTSVVPQANRQKGTTELSQLPKAGSGSEATSEQRLNVLVNAASSTSLTPQVTVAEVLRDPDQYAYRPFIMSGVATSLGDGKYLLNDGTGQVLVELDDDAAAEADTMGVSVAGELDDDLELEACSVTYQSGTIVIDDCDDGLYDDDDGILDGDDDDWDDDRDDDLADDDDDDDDLNGDDDDDWDADDDDDLNGDDDADDWDDNDDDDDLSGHDDADDWDDNDDADDWDDNDDDDDLNGDDDADDWDDDNGDDDNGDDDNGDDDDDDNDDDADDDD